MNVLYLGDVNIISIAANNYYCKDIRIAIDNGKIDATEKDCTYKIIVDKVGKATIKLYSKKDEILIGKSEFRVRHFPLPVPMVAGRRDGVISYDAINSASEIVAICLPDVDMANMCDVKSCKITVYRNCEVIFQVNQIGGEFDPSLKKVFKELKPYDEVKFQNIVSTLRDGKEEDIGGLELIIR